MFLYSIKKSYTASTLPLKTKPEWYCAKNCTVLAACWQCLHCNVEAVQVLSISDFKGGTSGSASRDIDSSWQLIYGLFLCWQKGHTGRHKSTLNAATQS